MEGTDLRICHAIANRALLMFGYRGFVRVVEPHLYGRNTAGHDALSAWMRPGWSRTDPEGGWRMFLQADVTALSILPETFDAPRPDYNARDPHFEAVYCQLPPLPESTDAVEPDDVALSPPDGAH
jgi:hypothetical protein